MDTALFDRVIVYVRHDWNLQIIAQRRNNPSHKMQQHKEHCIWLCKRSTSATTTTTATNASVRNTVEDMLFYVHNTFTHFLLAYISLKCNSRWECNFGLEIFARLKRWIHKKHVARVFMTSIFYIYIINRGWVHAIRFDVFQPCSLHFFFYFMVSSNNSKKNNLILYNYLYEIIGVNTLHNKKFVHSTCKQYLATLPFLAIL